MSINNVDRQTDTHIYFWNTIYSQWYTTKGQFIENGVSYDNAEKYMMMQKAKVFGAMDIYKKMKSFTNARAIKQLGREIPNFSDEEWDKHKIGVVEQANYLKFTQNPNLLKKLLDDKDLILVEASPQDRIWGIGLHFDNDDVLDESKWQGQNLLGKCIMSARDRIIKEGIN